MVWNDLKDRLKRFYTQSTATKKMELIHRYYSKRPPVHPNYWLLDQKDIILSNHYKKKAIFLIRSRSKIGKTSSVEESESGKSGSPRKPDMMFTSKFYKELDSSKSIALGRWTPLILYRWFGLLRIQGQGTGAPPQAQLVGECAPANTGRQAGPQWPPP